METTVQLWVHRSCAWEYQNGDGENLGRAFISIKDLYGFLNLFVCKRVFSMFPSCSFSATTAQKQDCSEAKIWGSLPKGSRSTVASISQKQKNCGTTRTLVRAGKPDTLEKILSIRDRINNQMPNGKCHPGWAPEIRSADERKIWKIHRPCSNPPIRADENKLVLLRLGKTRDFGLMKQRLNFSPSAWDSHSEECTLHEPSSIATAERGGDGTKLRTRRIRTSSVALAPVWVAVISSSDSGPC